MCLQIKSTTFEQWTDGQTEASVDDATLAVGRSTILKRAQYLILSATLITQSLS